MLLKFTLDLYKSFSYKEKPIKQPYFQKILSVKVTFNLVHYVLKDKIMKNFFISIIEYQVQHVKFI